MNLSKISRETGLYDILEPAYSRYQIFKWSRGGSPLPAPSARKRQLLKNVARQHGIRTLVETGTYKADTVRALRRSFSQIISIELDPALHAAALRRCRHQSNAKLYTGDSSVVLRNLVPTLTEKALFWLDAHYSGSGTAFGKLESPILAELEAVLAAQRHVVLIDDAREFHNPVNGYPPTSLVEELADRHGYTLNEREDVLLLTPPAAPSDRA